MLASPDQSAPPDVSICIVNWNCRAMLAELLESIEQEGGDATIETVIVDNASTDGAVEMVRQRFPWAKVIVNDHNAGFAKANNQAAAAAKGRHLFFLNNDTRVYPGAVAALAKYLDEHPDVSVTGPKTFLGEGAWHCNCRRFPGWGALLNRLSLLRWTRLFARAERRYLMHGLEPDKIQPVDQMDGAALMIRREALESVGGWDEGFTFGLEDVDLCARLAATGKTMYVPTGSIFHHGSVSQAANRDYARRNFEFGYARYLAKHGRTRFAAPLYKLLVTLDQLSHVGHVLMYMIKWFDYKRRKRPDLLEKHRRWLHAQIGFVFELPKYWRTSGPRDWRKQAFGRPAKMEVDNMAPPPESATPESDPPESATPKPEA